MTGPVPQPERQADTDPPEPQIGPQPDADQRTPQQEPPDPRVQQLELQLAAERAAHEFGVPVEMLSGATSPEDIERICSEALLWRLQAEPQAPPPPPTGAVRASEVTGGTGVLTAGDRAALNPRYTQVQTRDQLSRMSPAEVLAAWKSGALSGIGVGAPQSNGQAPMNRRR
jgi:hypothetical protein